LSRKCTLRGREARREQDAAERAQELAE